MQTVSLTWQHSGELAGALAVGSVALRAVGQRQLRRLAPFLLEAAILGALYALWQLAGQWSVTGSSDAFRRAHWIIGTEHDLGLPSERSIQDLLLGHSVLVQAANLYYASMHFTIMFVFLIWLFVRHRDQYRPVRATMAWTTLVCLLIQLIPVAPPRMIGGYVDTAALYRQSVYSNGLAADQLSAMPSVHVAWAMVVGWYAFTISRSRWRWLAVGHAVLTVFVVVATANHWWLDGVVATAVLVACAQLRHWISTGMRALVQRVRPVAALHDPASQPVPASP